MAAGIKVWDQATGALILDVTDSLARIGNSGGGTLFVSAGTFGTVTDDIFLTGTPFCIRQRSTNGATVNISTLFSPRVSFAGNVMSWDCTAPSGDHRLIYGAY